MTADLEAKAEEILRLYEQPKAAMLPLLWLVQENLGYVTQDAEAWVGRTLGVARSHVREAVSFYNMFHTNQWAGASYGFARVCHASYAGAAMCSIGSKMA